MSAIEINGQKRKLGRWVEALVSLMMLPACLVAALAFIVFTVVLLLLVIAAIAAIPAMVVAWKLSGKKGEPDVRRTRRSPLLRRDV